MKIGKAWLVVERDEGTDYSKLISIMPPRLPSKYVKLFVEQTFVDRHGDLNEKIMHKKRASKVLKAINQGSVISLKVSGEKKYIVAYCTIDSRVDGKKIYYKFPLAVPYKGAYQVIESEELSADI